MLKFKVSEGCGPSRDLRRIHSLPFPASGSCLHSLAQGPFLWLQSQAVWCHPLCPWLWHPTSLISILRWHWVHCMMQGGLPLRVLNPITFAKSPSAIWGSILTDSGVRIWAVAGQSWFCLPHFCYGIKPSLFSHHIFSLPVWKPLKTFKQVIVIVLDSSCLLDDGPRILDTSNVPLGLTGWWLISLAFGVRRACVWLSKSLSATSRGAGT